MGTKPQAVTLPDAAGLWQLQEAMLRAGMSPELLCAWSWLWARAGFSAGQVDFTLSQLGEPRDKEKPTAKLWVDALCGKPWRLIKIIETRTGRRGGYSVDVLDPIEAMKEKLHRVDPPPDAAQGELPLEVDEQDETTTEPTEPATVPFSGSAGQEDDEPPPRPAAALNVQPSSGHAERLVEGDATGRSGLPHASEAAAGGNVQSSSGQAERLAADASRTRVGSLKERTNTTSSKGQTKTQAPNPSAKTKPGDAARASPPRHNHEVLRGVNDRVGGPAQAGELLARFGGANSLAIADRSTRQYEEAKSNASRRILSAVRKAEARVGIRCDPDDSRFMRPWVADEWGHHFAENTIGLVDVDEMVRDLAAQETFTNSPGALTQFRGRKLVESRGGNWRAGSKEQHARDPLA